MAQPTLTPDVLGSPALGLLLDLELLGCRVELTPSVIVVTPASKLTATNRRPSGPTRLTWRFCCPAVTTGCRPAGPPSAGNSTRTRTPYPALVYLSPAPAYTRGRCYSCSDALPRPTWGRCWRCSLAWRLAAGVPIPGALADALDNAKVDA